MRALLGLTVLLAGCDLLFQIDHLDNDTGRPLDGKTGDGTTGVIAISARGTARGDAATTVLPLDFGAVQPKPSDMTLVAICYNNDQVSSVMKMTDAHDQPLAPLLTTLTPLLHSELWLGRVQGNVTITFSQAVNRPDARAIAYSGIDQIMQPLSVGGTVTGSQAVSAGPIPIQGALDVVIAATCVAGQTTGIAGFTQELEANGNWLADLQVPGPDSLIVTASQLDVAQGILQVAALPAAE